MTAVRRFYVAAVISFALGALGLPSAASAPDRLSALHLPSTITLPALQSLLQDFVDAAYGKGFDRLGEEADFDHGHLLLDAVGRPVAVLYHTQELAHLAKTPNHLDPAARNWIEWIDGHKVEDARRYLRKRYPSTATWDWFRLQRLPMLEARHTILDKMLDPDLLGAPVEQSRQWVFTRRACSAGAPDLKVRLPTKEEVCLALSGY